MCGIRWECAAERSQSPSAVLAGSRCTRPNRARGPSGATPWSLPGRGPVTVGYLTPRRENQGIPGCDVGSG